MRKQSTSKFESKLSHKMLLVFGVTMLASLLLLVGVSRYFLMGSFSKLERQQVTKDVEQAKASLGILFQSLNTVDEDYAYWDQAYGFMRDKQYGGFEKELPDPIIAGLGVNFVLVQDASGNTVFYKGHDPNGGTVVMPERVLEKLTAAWSLQMDSLWEKPQHGVLTFPDGTYLITARAIVTSQRTGPPLGVMFMGRRFDKDGADKLAQMSLLSVDLHPLGSRLPIDYQTAWDKLQRDASPTQVVEIGENRIEGFTQLRDIFGEPALLLRVDSPRPIHQRGLLSTKYVIGAVGMVALLSLANILIFFNVDVLRRLGQLSADVQAVGGQKAGVVRVSGRGRDEIAKLGTSINGMLDDLQQSQMQFDLLAENIHQAFWTKNVKTGKFDYVSRAYEAIWGQSRELLYRNPNSWTKVVHREDRKAIEEMAESQKGGRMGEASYRICLPGGRTRWIWERFFPVFDGNGEFTQIIGLAEDVTKFKEVEEAMRQSQEELEIRVEARTAELAASSEQIRLLLEAVPHGVYGLTRDGNCSFCNPACLEMLGYESAAEMLGKNIHELIHHTRPDGRPYARSECPQVKTMEAGVGVNFDGDVYWKKDGTSLPVEVWCHPFGKNGTVDGAVVTFIDISERKRLELELRHSQKLEAVGRLAAGIAHEINTPIQFVGDNTRFLQDSFRDVMELVSRYEALNAAARLGAVPAETLSAVEEGREKCDWEFLKEEIPRSTEQMLEGLGRVATIVRGMKEFSHVDRKAEKTEADLNRALASTLVVARNELKYVADVETHFEELPRVSCHLGDLNQVFLNLLVNAAHAIEDVMKRTNVRGKIDVRTRKDGDWVEVAIADTGGGIPEAIREKIFDPFFTTKEVGKGTGQGLALARAIVVEKHGGTLTLETTPGVGTTFYVRLPLVGAIEPQEVGAQ